MLELVTTHQKEAHTWETARVELRDQVRESQAEVTTFQQSLDASIFDTFPCFTCVLYARREPIGSLRYLFRRSVELVY